METKKQKNKTLFREAAVHHNLESEGLKRLKRLLHVFKLLKSHKNSKKN